MPRRRKKSRKKIYIISSIIILVLLLGGFFYWKEFKTDKVVVVNNNSEKKFYEINDETIGVNFKISKRFERMSSNELQAMNAGFLYGFSIEDDNKVKCYISQTKRMQGGQVPLSALRDGVFEQIKKNKQEANLDEAEIIEIGENNKGAKLKMSFIDPGQNNIPTLQWEVSGITDKAATFAFCAAPKAVIELYQDDFNLFLDSVRIK